MTNITYKHFVWSSSLAIKRLNFLCMCGQCQRQTTWLSQTWILSILQKQKQHASVMGSNTWLNMGLMPFHIYAYNGVWLWYISLPVKWQEQSNCSCLCIHASQMITALILQNLCLYRVPLRFWHWSNRNLKGCFFASFAMEPIQSFGA